MDTGHRAKLQYDCVVLMLQGGGALGAYQAGVFEEMAEAGYAPDWITGVSIGAINGQRLLSYFAVARYAASSARTKEGCSVPNLADCPCGAAGGTENHSVV